jgi:hypothetical protein
MRSTPRRNHDCRTETGHLFLLLPIHSPFFLPYLFSDILFMHLCRYIPHRHSRIALFFLLYQFSSFGFFGYPDI